MRSATTESCNCGNIEVTGTVAKRIARESTHGTSGVSLRVGPQAITIASVPDVTISAVGAHEMNITCHSCGAKLNVRSGESGAVCKLSSARFDDGCRSLPADIFFDQYEAAPVPKAFAALFKDQTLVEPVSFSADDFGLDTGDSEDDSDFDIMFSGQNDPLVGSYNELCLFTRPGDHLRLVE